MPIATQKIHRKLIARLILGWLLLSILIGAFVYFVEMKKVDEFVVNLAVEESGSFTAGNGDYLNSAGPDRRTLLLEKSRGHITMGHFISVELYNRSREKIVDVVRPGAGFSESVMDRHRQQFLASPDVAYTTFRQQGGLFVHVAVPLKDRSGGRIGSFMGVYEVDRMTLSSIKERIASSLVQAVVAVLATTLMLYPVIIALNKDLLKLTLDLSRANIGMLKTLGSAVAKRDSGTNSHNYRVTLYAVRLAEAIGLRDDVISSLMKGSFLHDVGKIGISDAILLKPGKLSPEEFSVMKSHPGHGADIIGGYSWLLDAMDVVRYHHEKFDGSGYPSGLRGDAIALSSRIFEIVDVFDALTSRRPYKEPLSFEEAMTIIEWEGGVCHDPRLVAVFSEIAPSLYREVGNAGDGKLEEALDGLIKTYFHSG